MDKEAKLKKLALSAIEYSQSQNVFLPMLDSLNISKEEVLEGYLRYHLNIMSYSNEIYEHLGTRFALYLQNILPGSWHIKRQDIVLALLNEISPDTIVDMGFGIPGKYINEYVLKNNVSLTLVDNYESAFIFAENFLGIWGSAWKKKIAFEELDMNHHRYVGDYDCYLFMDSIEHVDEPTKYLKRTVKNSLPGSKFVFSIPIGPRIPSHTIEWRTEEDAIEWLNNCGLTIERKHKVYPNPEVDLFAEQTNGNLYDIILSCGKKHELINLRLLDDVKRLHQQNRLENTLLIVCQHILLSNFVLVDYMIKMGIKPSNIFLIGKSYSTCQETMKYYEKIGVYVDAASLAFDSHLSFDDQFSRHTKRFMHGIIEGDLSTFDKILILDDGGQLIAHANDTFKDDKRVVGVEQTSSGYHRLKKLCLNFPVINVATSKAKLEFETPMIVEVVCKEILKRLRQMDRTIERILVIGNGPIGRQIANRLRSDYLVYVYDKHKELTCLSEQDFAMKLHSCDMIIGCTGETGISEAFYPLLKKKAILVSASSSDREFECHKIRKRHPKTSNTHKDFHGDDIILLNGGFPINFDGYKLSVPLEQIQLTEALLLSGVIQAIQSQPSKGIIDLDPRMQRYIIEKFDGL